jgi:multidrug efflux pump subunit AcrB
LVVDKEKAALNGVSEEEIALTMALASSGYQAGLLHADSAKEDVPLMLRLDRASRSDLRKIQSLKVAGRTGRLVALSELLHAVEITADKSIYHKNLMPVTYVTGDVAGAMESPVYAILMLGPEMDKFHAPEGYTIEFGEGTFDAQVDCNRASGTYTSSNEGLLTITPGPSTVAACPEGSLGSDYLVALQSTTSQPVTDGRLVLTTPDGTLTFE